jgi:hypothetical protein
MSPQRADSTTTAIGREAHAARLRARRLKSDLRFLRIYARIVGRVMGYREHAEELSLATTPEQIVERTEHELAGEAAIYRSLGWCILALLVAIPGLSFFLYSAMYWLPMRIWWFPFHRGNYGLPLFSLYEWLAYLLLALYFVVAGALLFQSHDETRRLGTEFRALRDADDATRNAIADIVSAGQSPRLGFVLVTAAEFAPYRPLLAEKGAA